MQTGQDWYGDDGPGSLDGSSLPKTQMRARLVVIERIQGQHLSQMPFVEDQHMIQAVAPQRPDQPLNIFDLPFRREADRRRFIAAMLRKWFRQICRLLVEAAWANRQTDALAIVGRVDV